MPKLLAAALLLAAAPALANPMLEKCLPFAPKECALGEKSEQAEFLKCFADVELKLADKAQRACAEELTHAKVHRDCAKEIETLCKGIEPGQGKTMACLAESRKKLGKACRASYRDWELSSGAQRKKRGASPVAAVRC